MKVKIVTEATKNSNQVVELIEKFARLKVGDSIFVPDAEPGDVEFLRRPALRVGCGIKIMRVELDEIYQQPGVRIWREEGSFDEL
jgi:hypothetical protein